MNVAIVINGIGDLSKVGGVERFFPYFFSLYCGQEKPENQLYIFTYSPNEILKFDFMKPFAGRVVGLKNISNRFKNTAEAFDLVRNCAKYKIDILHFANYYASNFGLLKSFQKFPKRKDPRIVINIVNCEIAYAYDNPANEYHDGYHRIYGPLFAQIRVDGIYAWNKEFKTVFSEPGRIRSNPYIDCIESRFADYRRFHPDAQKKNQIVFASRMDARKKPFWFLEAIRNLLRDSPELCAGWSFLIYGRGPVEQEVADYIREQGLTDFVRQGFSPDLSDVFNASRCFVSMQDYDNFPSLAMNEAMASGNAIIARNVGQTDYFVKHGENGFLLEEDSPAGLTKALRQYLSSPGLHETLQNNSVRLTKELHTPANFIRQIDAFWKELNQRRSK